VRPTRPLTLACSLLLLALALACGGGREQVPAAPAAPSEASLGDLLAVQPEPPAAAGPVPEAAPSEGLAAILPPATPPLPELGLETLMAQAAEQAPETPECAQARAALRERRTDVDARRAGAIADAERTLASGQLAMQNCIKSTPCNRDAEAMAAAQTQAETAEGAYQAAMQKVSAWEAELFPFEQTVDRACGRR
jgi:hypothetical protein